MTSRSLSKFAVVLLVAGLVQQAVAQPCSVTVRRFLDRATFVRVTGAVAEPALPARGWVSTPFLVGSLSLSYSAPSTRMACSEWTALHPGNEIALSQSENLDVAFGRPVYSFGLSVVEHSVGSHCGGGCVDTTFRVDFENNGMLVGSTTFNAPDDVEAFIGFATARPFTDVHFRDLQDNIDNEYFGSFYVGTKAIPVATCQFRNGSGVNPADFCCLTPPVLGSTWDTTIAIDTNTVRTWVGVATSSQQVPLLGGEVLITPGTLVETVGNAKYTIFVPNLPDLLGQQLFAQGFRLQRTPNGLAFQLLNGLDLVPGRF